MVCPPWAGASLCAALLVSDQKCAVAGLLWRGHDADGVLGARVWYPGRAAVSMVTGHTEVWPLCSWQAPFPLRRQTLQPLDPARCLPLPSLPVNSVSSQSDSTVRIEYGVKPFNLHCQCGEDIFLQVYFCGRCYQICW